MHSTVIATICYLSYYYSCVSLALSNRSAFTDPAILKHMVSRQREQSLVEQPLRYGGDCGEGDEGEEGESEQGGGLGGRVGS